MWNFLNIKYIIIVILGYLGLLSQLTETGNVTQQMYLGEYDDY